MPDGSMIQFLREVLNRPLFGTQHRSQWVFVEGQLTKFQSVVGVALIGLMLISLGKWGLKPFGRYAQDNLCTAGWFGWSLGGELSFLLTTAAVVPAVIACFWMTVNGYQIWKRQRTIPIDKKPLFRTRLIEGRAAGRYGIRQMVGGGVCALLVIFLMQSLHSLSIYFLKPPEAIASCVKK